MKKIYNIKYLLYTLLFFLATSCSNEFDINPKGTISEGLVLGNPDQIEGYIISAYAGIPNLGFVQSHNPWMHGSIRSDDAYKGGGGFSDQLGWHNFEIFTAVTPASVDGNNDGPFYGGYRAISRCNQAIASLNLISEEDLPEKDIRMGEMKFLRGSTYFFMKTLWRYIPWIDENNMSMEAVKETPNREDGTNDKYLWERILADLEEAYQKLPESQGNDLGRVNKNAARALCAKTLLFMAYEQNERHQVVNINKGYLERALVYLNELTDQEGSVVDLCEDYANNFLPEYDNATKESIWEIQYSIDDGTDNGGRINWGDELNAPWWVPHFSCCDFHKISYNLVNAFRTDAEGLPLFDTFNDAELQNNRDNYFANNTFDPRLSHTAAIPGFPFKYDPALIYDSIGSRTPAVYGYMNSMKEQVHPDCSCVLKPFYVQNSMNKRNVRYAEVLLWKAEALIQLDRYPEARPILNKLRQRAANSTTMLKFNNGDPYLNYKIGMYSEAKWTKEYAWKALMFENRVETGGEGRRFFDLQRWGILEPTINAYFDKESTRYSWMNDGHFVAGRDEYKPIPQAQMGWMAGKYTQNPGY